MSHFVSNWDRYRELARFFSAISLSTSIMRTVSGSTIIALRGGVVAHILRDFHRAKLWPAHRTKMRDFGGFFRQGFVVKTARGVWV